jgi:uncharacterized protein YcbX
MTPAFPPSASARAQTAPVGMAAGVAAGVAGARVAHLVRHPLKGIGREELASATLRAGAPFPGDRLWAVRDAAGAVAAGAWAECRNFARGAKAPLLMAVSARLDAAARRVWLSHPDRPDIDIAPDAPADEARLIAWLDPLIPPDRPRPAQIVPAPAAMTDTPYPSVSILSLASLRAVSRAMGRDLDMHRFRGNIWIDGCQPWAEAALVGHEIRIGGARLRVVEQIHRCRATMADPATGQIDAEVLSALRAQRGEAIFGLYAEVTGSGDVAVGDALA